MKRLVIIDGKSVFYRGYYAMGALSTSDGTPTGGVYGFAAIAMEIVRKLQPTKVAVAWDSRSSTAKRKALYPEYKAGRKKPDEDFYAQIPLLEELVRALGWGFVEVPEYEADDIIGTLAYQADEITAKYVSSSDRMSRQPAVAGVAHPTLSAVASESSSDNTSSAAMYRSDSSCSDGKFASCSRPAEEDCLDGVSSGDLDEWETYIVSSDLDMLQIVDENTRMYRILKGFTDLEELDVAAVEKKYGIRKAQFLDLKALKGDASDNIPGVPGVGEKTAVKLLNEFGTLEEVYENLEKVPAAVRKKLEAGKESAFMSYRLAKIMTDAPVALAEVPDLVINEERIVAALKKLEFRLLVARFLKAQGGEAEKAAGGAERAKEGRKNTSGLDTAERAEKVGNGRKMASQSVLGGGTRASGISRTAGMKKRGKSGEMDLFSGQQSFGLLTRLPDGRILAWDVKDLMHKNSEVAKEILEGQKFWDLGQAAFLLNPLERGVEWTEEKAEYERQQRELAERPELLKVYEELDLPLIPILYKMEEYGMLIDRKYFAGLKEEFEGEARGLEEKIWVAAGTQFNVNSPVQLADVLFNRLKLPTKGIKKTARGYSTGVKELDKLEGQHEIIGLVKEYRETAKLLSTYIGPLPELADAQGRVHTTFNQNVTATGRLSSTNPNMQNIPVRTEVGKRIREGFVAPEGRVLVSADYAQFELRLAAVLAGDEALIQDFNDDVDIHTKTASEAFGVPMNEVTKAQRRAAKVINFGILYGMSVRGLAEAADMGYAEAKQFIEHYFELRKPIKEYLEGILRQAREKGYVETMMGRRRPTPDVKSSNFIVRTGAERAAQNMPIQGTEADLMKRAMKRIDEKLEQEFDKGAANMVMQVHDSVIVECDEGVEEKVGKVLQEVMEGVAPELAVKLAVEVSYGKNWGEL